MTENPSIPQANGPKKWLSSFDAYYEKLFPNSTEEELTRHLRNIRKLANMHRRASLIQWAGINPTTETEKLFKQAAKASSIWLLGGARDRSVASHRVRTQVAEKYFDPDSGHRHGLPTRLLADNMASEGVLTHLHLTLRCHIWDKKWDEGKLDQAAELRRLQDGKKTYWDLIARSRSVLFAVPARLEEVKKSALDKVGDLAARCGPKGFGYASVDEAIVDILIELCLFRHSLDIDRWVVVGGPNLRDLEWSATRNSFGNGGTDFVNKAFALERNYFDEAVSKDMVPRRSAVDAWVACLKRGINTWAVRTRQSGVSQPYEEPTDRQIHSAIVLDLVLADRITLNYKKVPHMLSVALRSTEMTGDYAWYVAVAVSILNTYKAVTSQPVARRNQNLFDKIYTAVKVHRLPRNAGGTYASDHVVDLMAGLLHTGDPLRPRPLTPGQAELLTAQVRELSRRTRFTGPLRRGADGDNIFGTAPFANRLLATTLARFRVYLAARVPRDCLDGTSEMRERRESEETELSGLGLLEAGDHLRRMAGRVNRVVHWDWLAHERHWRCAGSLAGKRLLGQGGTLAVNAFEPLRGEVSGENDQETNDHEDDQEDDEDYENDDRNDNDDKDNISPSVPEKKRKWRNMLKTIWRRLWRRIRG